MYLKIVLAYSCLILIILQPCPTSHESIATLKSEEPFQDKESSFPVEQRDLQNLLYNSSYHDYPEIIQELNHLEKLTPGIVDVIEIGRSWENRSIPAIILTNESVDKTLKPSVLFVGLHHARELVSAEIPLYLASDLVHGYILGDEWVVNLLNDIIIYIVPVLNPDGLEEMKNHPLQRKNLHPNDEDLDGRIDEDPPEDNDRDYIVERVDNDNDSLIDEDWKGGIDLNRNYGYKFKYPFAESWSDNPASQLYAGEYPFSEPETRALMELSMAVNFTTAMSFHSGTNATLFPWSYTRIGCPHSQVFESIRMDIAHLSLLPQGYETTGDVWYTMAGEWGDWMYGNRSCYAATIELYQNGSFENTFEYYNPDKSSLDEFYCNIKPFLVYWLDQTPRIFFYQNELVQLITANEILNTSYVLVNPSSKFRIQNGAKISLQIVQEEGLEIISAESFSISGFRAGENAIIPVICRCNSEGNFTLIISADSDYAGKATLEITIVVLMASKVTSGWHIASVINIMVVFSSFKRYHVKKHLSNKKVRE
ncbi:MAG: M14 family zinc carboxypeptidase [Candidatus Hodarchaeales archaeon]